MTERHLPANRPETAPALHPGDSSPLIRRGVELLRLRSAPSARSSQGGRELWTFEPYDGRNQYLSAARPDPCPPVIGSIPDELKSSPTWVCWQWGWRQDRLNAAEEGRWVKFPISPETGDRVEFSDPTTRSTFDRTVAFAERHALAGVGLAFGVESPFAGINLDDCVDPVSGRVAPWAREIIETVGSYTEVSPGGRGLHIVFRSQSRSWRTRWRCDEFLTVTGRHLPGHPTTVEDRWSEELSLRLLGGRPRTEWSRAISGSDQDDAFIGGMFVQDDVVAVTTDVGETVRLNAATGERAAPVIERAPAASHDRKIDGLTVRRAGNDKTLEALDEQTGGVVWSKLLSKAHHVFDWTIAKKSDEPTARWASIPASEGNDVSDRSPEKIVVVRMLHFEDADAVRYDLIALDAATGEWLWGWRTEGDYWVCGEPLVHRGRVFFHVPKTPKGCLYVVDALTHRWLHGMGTDGNLVAAGGGRFFIAEEDKIWALNAVTCEILWFREWDDERYGEEAASLADAPPLPSDAESPTAVVEAELTADTLYVTSPTGSLLALDVVDGRKRWSHRIGDKADRIQLVGAVLIVETKYRVLAFEP